MKKILYILALTAGITFTSCDFDQMPSTSIPNREAFDDMPSILALERGTYARLQAAYNTACILTPDIMGDYMHAVAGFTGAYNQNYYWTYTTETSEIATTWNTLYATIAQANFTIDGLKNPMELPFSPTAADLDKIEFIVAKMKLMRAMCYNLLVERFCADYEAATADAAYSGVPYVSTYDVSHKPDRETLANCYKFILQDIADAETVLAKGTHGAPNTIGLTYDCARALRARVMLQMDKPAEAYDIAMELINTKTYPLVGSAEELKRMWEYDKSSEIMFVFYASTTELPLQYGSDFYRDNYNGLQAMHMMLPNYIPTQSCLDTYEANDWRRTAYFLECSTPSTLNWLYIPAFDAFAYKGTLLSKYPGNPDLRTTTGWNYYNSYKPFRIAEMYLIAAEAGVQAGKDAKTPLNDLRAHRGLTALDAVTLKDVQEERYRELIMEGHRLTDLKRWKMDVQRGQEQMNYITDNGTAISTEKMGFATGVAKNIEIKYDDYMSVWPIPASEVFANQKLAEQQNPGWKR